MNPKQTFIISINKPVSFETTLSDMTLFLHESLFNHFVQVENTDEKEIIFLAKEQSCIRVKEVGINQYQFVIESETEQVVNGLIGYLDEVFDETAFDFAIDSKK